MRVVANIVTGVGFLGAGLILKEGANIRGLNTAATVWCSAAVGACAGANLHVQAVLAAAFILVCNTALRPLAALIDRLPAHDETGEARYVVALTVPAAAAKQARQALVAALAEAAYPVSDWEQHARPGGQVEVMARLVSSSVRGAELDAVLASLRRALPDATDAAWTRSRLE
jgi:putative Mg2+ transporter-C (MgtC) family protein